MIAFACAPGHTVSASSLNNRNSVFTWHLLQYIGKPNQDIGIVLRDVSLAMHDETKNSAIPQIPWINNSLKDTDIFLYSVTTSGKSFYI